MLEARLQKGCFVTGRRAGLARDAAHPRTSRCPFHESNHILIHVSNLYAGLVWWHTLAAMRVISGSSEIMGRSWVSFEKDEEFVTLLVKATNDSS